jgi:hypothetical protein
MVSNCWWAPVSVAQTEQYAPGAREQWVKDQADLPAPAALIDFTDPAGRRWLTLEGHYQWQEPTPPEVDRYDVDRCTLWYQIRSYFVRSMDLSQLADWMKGKNWMGRWMPESHDFHYVFLGEYPWHPSAAGTLRDWEQPQEYRCSLPVPILVTSASYSREGSGYDYSLDDAVSGFTPSPPLLSSLALRWEGKAFRYVDAAGQLVAWDPSSDLPGPPALLIDYEVLAKYLQDHHLSVVWTVLGEKLIQGSSVITAPRLEVHGALLLDSGKLELIEMASELDLRGAKDG